MDCLVWEGLGNRFNAIASALATTKGEVNLYWSVNKHLPLSFEEVFRPVDRLRVKNVNASRFEYSRNSDRICYYYVCNPKAIASKPFSELILSNYRLLFDSMLPEHRSFDLPKSSVGIHYRSFLDESKPFFGFLDRCRQWIDAKRIAPEAVFVSSDNVRYTRLMHACLPNAKRLKDDDGMRNDFDRVPSFKHWLKALDVFSRCYGGVYSSCARSTAFDVMRGYGIATTFDEAGKHHRDARIENDLNKRMTTQWERNY